MFSAAGCTVNLVALASASQCSLPAVYGDERPASKVKRPFHFQACYVIKRLKEIKLWSLFD